VNALGQPVTVYNPATGMPYNNNQVPVSAQAKALLRCIPAAQHRQRIELQLPGAGAQQHASGLVAVEARQDAGRKDQLYGTFNLSEHAGRQREPVWICRSDRHAGHERNVHWSHRLKPRIFLFTNYAFSRLRTEVTPNFANRVNVSGRNPGGNQRQRSRPRRLGSAGA
jgi:trimeric autotransporter adhesin